MFVSCPTQVLGIESDFFSPVTDEKHTTEGADTGGFSKFMVEEL